MSTAIGTRTFGGWKRYTGQHLRVAFAGMVALAAVAGVGAWQAMDSEGHTSTSSQRATISKPASRGAELTYYIVSTETQADSVRRAEDEALAIRLESGDVSASADFEVLVAPAGDAGQIPAIVDLNGVRAALGLTEVQVMDLRQQ